MPGGSDDSLAVDDAAAAIRATAEKEARDAATVKKVTDHEAVLKRAQMRQRW
jgi:hypothetical protein